MSSVFVSHASADNLLVARLVADLRRAGHTVWVDLADLAAGDVLVREIGRGLEDCDAFLLLLSRTSAASNWVEMEWETALTRKVANPSYTVLVARLDDVEVPRLLASMKWIDLAADYEQGLSIITSSLSPRARADREKQVVWYFDDSPAWVDAFAERHSSVFSTRGFQHPVELMTALHEARAKGAGGPDIVLLDLYCPQEDADPSAIRETDELVSEYIRAERELKKAVDDAWKPIGVSIVESVRQFYSPEWLPIAMHTQQGLFLLRDELLQELEEMGAGWLLKNRFSPDTDRMVLERIIMRSGCRMRPGRQRVLIIDDNPKFLDAFVSRHGDYYEIETLTSEAQVLRTLNRLEDEGRFPDIFVVDMYYPRGNDAVAQEFIAVGNQRLDAFAQLEKNVQQAVRHCYQPIGLSALREIRRIMPPGELPVLVYTQSGMLMLEDRGIQEIERLGGAWLLKDRYGARTEEAIICGEILRARRVPAGTDCSGRA